MAVADITMNKHFEPVGIYALGYLDAAAGLFDRADKGHGLVDYAFYPAALCLRHGLELFIKQISIYVAYEMTDPALLYKPGHRLGQEWGKLKEFVGDLIRSSSPGEDLQSHLDVIDSVIEDLDELDPTGTLFRYPEDVTAEKSGKPRTRQDRPPPFDTINLTDWASTARSVLTAAQLLLYDARDRAGALASQRGDPPIHFHDTTMKK